MTSGEAKKAGSDWVSWKVGRKQYANLKADVTFSAVTALLPKVAGTRLSRETIHGSPLDVLKWSIAAKSNTPQLANTLTLSVGGTTLPIHQITTASGGTKATTTLSDWGEDVVVRMPPASTTIASLKISD